MEDVSLSTTSSNNYDHVDEAVDLSININGGPIISMTDEDLGSDDVWNVTWHGKYAYIVTYDAVYKCVAKSNYILSAIQAFLLTVN